MKTRTSVILKAVTPRPGDLTSPGWLSALVCGLLFCGTLHAQQHVIAAGAEVRDSCKHAVEIAANELREIGNDKPWTWGVVCSTRDWDLLTRTAQIDSNTDCAVTLLSKSFTYINAACLYDPKPTVTPGYLMAHELGHIATGSTKEKDADEWAKQRGFAWGKN